MRKLNENEQHKLDEMIHLQIEEEKLLLLEEDEDKCPQCSRELDYNCCNCCGEVYLWVIVGVKGVKIVMMKIGTCPFVIIVLIIGIGGNDE